MTLRNPSGHTKMWREGVVKMAAPHKSNETQIVKITCTELSNWFVVVFYAKTKVTFSLLTA